MTLVVLGCLWVLASAAVAMMPMRYQYAPGILLMIAAPVLIWLFAAEFGVWIGLAATFAFLSMFRNPLRYFFRRAMGQTPEIPK